MEQLATALDRLAKRMRPYAPFTEMNTIIRNLDKKGKTLLDVGCARGEAMQMINKKKRWSTTGLDIYEPYLNQARQNKTHDHYVLCDVRNLDLPAKSYDIVLCTEVLEHLGREEGLELLRKLEKVARRQVVISTPQGKYVQHAFDGNAYQEHKTIWTASELKKLGFQVRGHGVPRIGGEGGLATRIPKVLVPLTNVLYVGAGPLVYYLPLLAGALVGIKRVK